MMLENISIFSDNASTAGARTITRTVVGAGVTEGVIVTEDLSTSLDLPPDGVTAETEEWRASLLTTQ